ncbi:MAG: DNA primase [Candidatus Aminicenantes bacterium RBG_16_63_14]|nr:MAG: DNA primase [Candidatus Aminicenantes bacterium RBG_16_63_14]OGD29359.1 MAG: DNA primase [Candidatus Aminicenantes bacterium RBG_19FT_COMBO_65_30]
MEIIDQVRQASSIVEIASQYTTLKRRGRKWVGLCPFHTEKTPSFTVDEEKQLYHCFGCGVGGDIYSLVMERENLTFPEALKNLAERYHIPLPAQQRVRPEVLKLEEKLFKINDLALGFFKKNLFNTQEGKKALEYLKKRGLSEETIQTLKIGYALNSWTALLDFFQEKDAPVSLLEKGGLVLPGQRTGEYRDRFRGRVIFPIFSLTGRVVAFGGRTVIDAEPKYLNSPETPLYSKGKLLYGLNFTKDAVRQEGTAILVEGYTDFSSLYQAGIRNVVASLGTALTAWQVGQAMRFASRLIINYDGDSAGRAAAARAVPLGFEKGLNVDVLVLPDELDPDAFLKKHGREKYLALQKKTVTGLDFLVDSMARSVRMTIPEEKGRVVRAIVREIEKVPDAVARSEYLRRASQKLGVGEELLRSIVEHKAPNKGQEEAGLFCPAEKRLFQILMEDRSVAPYVFAECGEEIFQGLRSEPVFQYILDCFRHDQDWSFPGLQGKVPPALLSHLANALFEKSSGRSVEEAQECLKSLRRVHLQNRLKDIQQKIARSEKNGEKEELLALLYQKQDITKQILSMT